MIWQGAPATMAIARRTLHIGLVAAYFGLLLVWRLLTAAEEGKTLAETIATSLPLLTLAAAALGLLTLIAWLTSRTTLYTITDKRVVMRYGIALPLTVNVPFVAVKSAGFKGHRDGTGDIVLEVSGPVKLGYWHLWPHARPWKLARPQPSLRGVPDAARVADILAGALRAKAGDPQRAAAAKPAAAQAEPQRPAYGVHAPAAA